MKLVICAEKTHERSCRRKRSESLSLENDTATAHSCKAATKGQRQEAILMSIMQSSTSSRGTPVTRQAMKINTTDLTKYQGMTHFQRGRGTV